MSLPPWSDVAYARQKEEERRQELIDRPDRRENEIKLRSILGYGNSPKLTYFGGPGSGGRSKGG